MKHIFQNLTAFILCIGISLSIHSFSVYASNVPDEIRIGLEYQYKNVSSVPISNKQIGLGSQINDTFQADVMLTAASNFTFTVGTSYYAAVAEMFSSYEAALAASISYQNTGYQSVPAYLGHNAWAVYLSGFTSLQEITEKAPSIEATINHSIHAVENSQKIVQLKDGQAPILVSGDEVFPQIMAFDNNGTLQLSNRNFRGRIEIGRYQSGMLTAVNVLDLEEYLYGVVPAEMPPSYELEALKAQSVAARTYAISISEMGTHKASGYELCDGIHCQVYKGYNGESSSTNEAVDATKGLAAYYNGQAINAVFCASSGGYTDNSENVWIDALPYLRAVPEIKEPDVNTWTKTFTASDIGNLLHAKGIQIGSVTDLIIRGNYGRVQELEIIGTGGNTVLKKEEIRTFFSGLGGSLESRMFQINGKTCSAPVSHAEMQESPVVNLPKNTVYVQGLGYVQLNDVDDSYVIGSEDETPIINPSSNISSNGTLSSAQTLSSSGSTANGTNTFVFTGSGSGHGVGMSQKGARGMAQLGYNFEEILKHYYTGITIE